MIRSPGLLLILAVLASSAAEAETREEQAQRNYQRLLNGQIGLADLTPQEQADVAEIDRRVRAELADDGRSPEQRCYELELEKLGPEPSYLARRSTALKCGITYEQAEADRAK